MSLLKNKRKRKIYIAVTVTVIVLAMIIVPCVIYLASYYRADAVAIEAFGEGESISWEVRDDLIVLAPDGATSGIIFYPGGKVEHTAYLPLMKALAAKGVLCVIVSMPLRLAVLDIDAANGIREQYPDIAHWYMCGHSLGGSMASSYLKNHTTEFEGLFLLGAYATVDLSDTELTVLSVYGSEDAVMNREKYDACKSNLPANFRELVIDGGCHACFGMCGAQKGDGIPSITNEEQIDITAHAIFAMVNRE